MKVQPRITEYTAFGGSNFDSIAHSALYRDDDPYNFGVMNARLFSSVNTSNDGTLNALGHSYKRWIALTEGRGHVEYLPAGKDTYTWKVVGDSHVQLVLTKKYVSAGEKVGQAGATFFIGVNLDWYGHPTVFKTMDDNAAGIQFVGQPVADGPNNFKVECRLQDGNPLSFLDDSLLNPGKTLARIGTALANELNDVYGTIGFSSQSSLMGQIGRSGNTISFTDRFMRMELATKGKGMTDKYSFGGKNYGSAFSTGYVYSAQLGAEGKQVERSLFIPTAEKLIIDQTLYDINYMMEFGRLETTLDKKTKRPVRVGAGWRQLYKDGHYMTHSGDFTLGWLYEKLHQILNNKRSFRNRKPMLVGGIGAISYLSKLIANEAPLNTIMEPGFSVRKNSTPTGVHEFEYEYGFQFTRIKLAAGIDVQIMYDPSKDNNQIYTQLAPGSYLPLESFQIDILDFGDTEDAAENTTGSNITMVKETMGDYYFSVYNAMRQSGPVTSGENVYKFGKELEVYHEMTGSLAIWDTSAIGRIEWIV